MEPIERFSVWGSGAIIVGILFLSLVALVTLWSPQPPESVPRDIPAADTFTTAVDDVTQSDTSDEQPATDRPQAVAAIEATPAPAQPDGRPSPTPTPALSSIEPPTTAGSRAPNETPLSPVPAAPPVPPPQTPISPAATPTATAVPPATPIPTPTDSCLQPESAIVMDHNHMFIERGSLVSYGAGVLVLVTADGPVSLVITVETQIIGNLALATQVRVEAQLTGNGKLNGRVVEVLCPLG